MNSKLKIYFYHTRLTRESYEEWKDFRFPGHILYGLPLLEKHGIQSVMHRYKPYANRWKLMLYTTKEILFCKEKYEVLFPWTGINYLPAGIGAIPETDCRMASYGIA